MNILDMEPETEPLLRRALGPYSLALIGISNAIGAGIFVLTGEAAAQHAGPAVALSYLLAAGVCLLTALCYAELGTSVPSAGGSYTYTAIAFGRFPAWIVGWCMVLEYMVAGSTVAVGWGAYAASFLAQIGLNLPVRLATPTFAFGADGSVHWGGGVNVPAAAIILCCTFVLIRGVRGSAWFNAAMVSIKIGVILLVIAVGVFYVHAENWRPFIPKNDGTWGKYGLSGIFAAAAVAFFAFTGFEAMSTAAREARNPERDLPVAIIGALAVCALLYFGMALILTGLAPYRSLNVAAPISAAISHSGANLGWLETVVNVGSILGLGSAVLVSLYGQSRVCYAMACNGAIPRIFATVNERTRTPAVGTLIIGCIAAIVSAAFPIDLLGELVSMGCLVAFGSVCLSTLALRKSYRKSPAAFRVPLFPYIPALGALSCLGLMFSLPRVTWMYMGIWIATGLIVYLGSIAVRRHHAMKNQVL